jgi:hypothetical protein
VHLSLSLNVLLGLSGKQYPKLKDADVLCETAPLLGGKCTLNDIARTTNNLFRPLTNHLLHTLKHTELQVHSGRVRRNHQRLPSTPSSKVPRPVRQLLRLRFMRNRFR